jgi:hypothetical protein
MSLSSTGSFFLIFVSCFSLPFPLPFPFFSWYSLSALSACPLFFSYLKCFVLIDLKTGELTHQDVGQMDMYVRMFDDLQKGEDDNPTVGLILCTDKDKAIVKYSVLKENKQLFASKYMLYLPSEEELTKELEREKWLIEMAMENGRLSLKGKRKENRG